MREHVHRNSALNAATGRAQLELAEAEAAQLRRAAEGAAPRAEVERLRERLAAMSPRAEVGGTRAHVRANSCTGDDTGSLV